ncbi:hypothetical protein SAY86_018666 [Trapa natans]|uniref:Mitochondrial import inner membrane translocase subunit n=1 Tax=Trapa natans TaxID=22666 RepID=A0AAN7LJH5_TRANT|nr:hypothetical protein SAY86_018666 [Trapa natans]
MDWEGERLPGCHRGSLSAEEAQRKAKIQLTMAVKKCCTIRIGERSGSQVHASINVLKTPSDSCYKESELNMGENSCIDRRVSKYWQVNNLVGQLLGTGRPPMYLLGELSLFLQ